MVDKGVNIVINCGGAFDFLTSSISRLPVVSISTATKVYLVGGPPVGVVLGVGSLNNSPGMMMIKDGFSAGMGKERERGEF